MLFYSNLQTKNAEENSRIMNFRHKKSHLAVAWFHLRMPKAGIEPARPWAVDFESTASTNSATPAQKCVLENVVIILAALCGATTITEAVCWVVKKTAFQQDAGFVRWRENPALFPHWIIIFFYLPRLCPGWIDFNTIAYIILSGSR